MNTTDQTWKNAFESIVGLLIGSNAFRNEYETNLSEGQVTEMASYMLDSISGILAEAGLIITDLEAAKKENYTSPTQHIVLQGIVNGVPDVFSSSTAKWQLYEQIEEEGSASEMLEVLYFNASELIPVFTKFRYDVTHNIYSI